MLPSHGVAPVGGVEPEVEVCQAFDLREVLLPLGETRRLPRAPRFQHLRRQGAFVRGREELQQEPRLQEIGRRSAGDRVIAGRYESGR